MAEGGGACTGEILDNVRELLRGQRRLEQLVVGIARGREAVTASGDSVALAQAAGEGAAESEARQRRDIIVEESEARRISSQGSRRLTATSDMMAAMGSGRSIDERIQEDSAKWPIETALWLERVEIRDKLVDCGSNDDLATMCRRESAVVRSRAPPVSDSHGRSLNAQSRSSLASRSSRLAMLCPVSRSRAWFDFISVCVLSYNLTSVPYYIAFQVDQGDRPWFTFECISVAFWSLDILLSFMTGYYADGILCMDPWKVACRYLTGSFFLDVLTLTVDIVALTLQVSETDSARFFRTLKIVRVMRLSAVMRMRNVNGTLERLGYSSPTFGAKMVGSLFNVFKFSVVLLWMNHTIACLWCSLGQEDAYQGSAHDTGHTWMDEQSGGVAGTHAGSGRAYQYTTAFHWALTQMTPGSMQVFPVNTAERMFNICVLMGGFMVFSIVVSAISSNAAQLRIDTKGVTQNMEGLTKFLLATHIQPGLRMQVCKQAQAKLTHMRPKAVKDLAVLDMISLSLRHALQLAICNPHFLEHPLLHFLSNHDQAMWEETCMACADFSVLVKGGNLFVFGKEAEGMYFVVRGALSYDLNDRFNENSQAPSKEAEPGAWISEAALWCRWRHMGCAEAKGAGCCEVLLLNATRFMPILTRKGLAGQMAWAYAHSFHYFLQNSKPPLCNWPNDLVLPFGSDEVIAAMQKDAAVIMGKWAIEFLKAQPGKFAIWAGSVREDKIDMLASEIRDGRSTLLVTSKQGVVRCVPLVVLRLLRQDGRVFVRMRLASKADGNQEATCKLPGGKQRAGEHPDMCLQRLLEGKLSALADGIEVVGVERQRESENSHTFGVPTRYVRTVVSAAWPEHAAAVLGRFLVTGAQPVFPGAAVLTDPTRSMDSTGLFGMGGRWTDGRGMPKRRWSKARGQTKEGSGAGAGARRGSAPGGPVEVLVFPRDSDFYAWLTEEQLGYFNTPQGQPVLSLWLSELCGLVEAPPAAPPQPAALGELDFDALCREPSDPEMPTQLGTVPGA